MVTGFSVAAKHPKPPTATDAIAGKFPTPPNPKKPGAQNPEESVTKEYVRLRATQVHLDLLSLQATLFHGKAVSWVERVANYMAHTSRIETK